MKASTAIGIGVAFAGLAAGALMEGASPTAFLNIPALLIVLGGTFGATFAGTTIEKIKLVPTLYKKAMSGEKPDLGAQLQLLVGFAERARREGLLALDEEVAELEDDFTRKGLQLVVDGTDPELVREILDNEIDGMGARTTPPSRRSRRPAASRRRWASSARSWGSCTCSRTSTRPLRSARPSPARSSRPCTASAPRTSSSSRRPTS